MTTKTRAFVQHRQNGPLTLESVTLATPTDHAVRVRLTSTGVCQSQIHWMGVPRSAPILFGHEGVGLVEAVGQDVSRVSVGDTVLVTWLPGPESATRAPGRTEAALSDGQTAFWNNVSTWSEHTIVDEQYLLPMPSTMRDPAIALIGCAVPTGAGAVINAGAVSSGDSVAVIGLGGVGLSAVRTAALRGARHVIAIDISDDKLEFSRRFGATHTVNSTTTDPVAAVHELATDLSQHPGVDVAIDCVGIEATVAQAVAMARDGHLSLRRGGRVVLVGVPEGHLKVDARQLLMKEKSIIGTSGGGCNHDDLRLFCDWALGGQFDPAALVTDTFPFEDLPAAVEALREGRILGRALIVMTPTT
jgi:Zn-dependent alcohol dehydrogenase